VFLINGRMMRRTAFLFAPMLGLLLAACEPEQNAMTLTAECGGEQPDAAISACTTLLSSDAIEAPIRVRTLINRANAKSAKGDHDAAIEDLSESIKLAPEMASTFVLLGNARQAKGDNGEAIDDYNQAIRLDPNITDAYIQRGTAFGATHQFDRAIQDFNIALKAHPGDAGILANRGSVRVRPASSPRPSPTSTRPSRVCRKTPFCSRCEEPPSCASATVSARKPPSRRRRRSTPRSDKIGANSDL